MNGNTNANCSVCGPNSEIEWNKEGSRGYTILSRNTAHTALSVTANNASAFGAQLNQQLNEPANTVREMTLCADDAECEKSSPKSLVTEDPQLVSYRQRFCLMMSLYNMVYVTILVNTNTCRYYAS